MPKLFVKEAQQRIYNMKHWRDEKTACGCLTSQQSLRRYLFMQHSFQQMHTYHTGRVLIVKNNNKKKNIEYIPQIVLIFLGVQCKNMSLMTAHISLWLLYSGSFLSTPYCLLHVNGLLTMYGVMRPWVPGQQWYMMGKIGLCCTDDLISIFWGLGAGNDTVHI